MTLDIQRACFRPRSFAAPYLDIAIRLDEASPGHLTSAMYGADLTRQARFFAYSAIISGQADEVAGRLRAREPDAAGESPFRLLGRALTTYKAKRIIEVVTGAPVPPGFLGILARLGHDPLSPDPDLYRVLWGLYADPRHRRRVKVLQQTSGQISATKIRTLAALDDLLVRKAVIDRIYDGNSVEPLGCLLGLIRSQCCATDAEIGSSLDTLPSAQPFEGFRNWAERWIEKQVRTRRLPPFPNDDPDLILRLGAGLGALGLRLQNCAKTVITDSFVGTRLVYEWVGPGGPATLEMVPAETGGRAIWVCEDVRAPRNRDPSAEAVAAIRAKLDHYGWSYRTRVMSKADQRALVNFVEPWGESGLPPTGDGLPVGVVKELAMGEPA